MFGFAAASPAVSTPGSRIAQPPTEYTPSSARRAYGVDILKHPDWAGDFLLSDCEQARSYFKRRVAFYDPIKVLTVWSRRWTKEEPESPVETFELPFGYRYTKDFGANVLPDGDKFVDVSSCASSGFLRPAGRMRDFTEEVN
ncbi:MAG: hypothetical protein L6R35_001343 [Caloplaca aegaea]|nr:MAG: hypothetical protein L6R35_001343 [Caloplaca aegaea]